MDFRKWIPASTADSIIMITNKIIFNGLNQDDDDRILQPGDYRDALNMRIGITEGENSGSAENVRGNTESPRTYSYGAGSYNTIGTYERKEDGSCIYFVYSSTGDHKIVRWMPDGGPGVNEIMVEGSFLNFQSNQQITGVAMVEDWLFFTDNHNGPRMLDVAKAARYQKAIEVELVFGKEEAGVNDVFVNGDTYSMSATDGSGASIFGSTLIYTSIGVTTIEGGVRAFCLAFNANGTVNSHFTARPNGKSAIITENTGTGTYGNGITSINFTATSSAPVEYYYLNRYDTYSEFIVSLAKYPPLNAPSVVRVTDSDKGYNYIEESVFQFQYRYVYDGGLKSVWSPVSGIAMPPNAPQGDKAYNGIEIDFSDDYLSDREFANEIVRVEIGVREHNTGDLRLFRVIDRAEWGLHRQYVTFYNDEEYPVINPSDAVKISESIPLKSKSLTATLQNNNSDQRIILAGNTEGYDNVTVDSTITPSFAAIFPSTGTYTLTWTALIINKFELTAGCVHQHEDDEYPTFGGIKLGGDYVNGVGTDYKQYLPEKGFVGYLAGTEYYCISKQNETPTVTTYVDSDHNVFDSSTVALRSDIETDINTGLAEQSFEISGLRPGRYVIRIASHWVSKGDKLGKGPMYDLNNGKEYQSTSTYVKGVNTGSGVVDNVFEIVVDLPHISTGTATVNAGKFIIEDLTRPVAGSSSDVFAGYLLDAKGSSDPEDLKVAPRMEGRVYRTYEGGTLQDSKKTDHNGFYFSGVNNGLANMRAEFLDQAGNPTISSQGSVHYEGGFLELEAGTLTTNRKNYTTGTFVEALTWNENDTFQEDYAIYLTGAVVNSSGSGIPGVVVCANHGRWAITDAEGKYRMLSYPDGNTTAKTGTLNFGHTAETVDINLSTANQIALSLTGYGTTYTLTDPYVAADIVVSYSSGLILNALKRGGVYQFGYVYYDQQGRPGFVNTSDEMKVEIPWYDENHGHGYYSLAVYTFHKPPEWAYKWQLVRTKNQRHQSFLQVPIEDVKYVRNYDEATEEANFVSYESGQASEVYLSIESIRWYREKHADSRIAYQFVEGDRVRFVKRANGDFYSAGEVYDFPIRTMRGYDLVVEVNNSIPRIEPGDWIEIYTPRAEADTKIFYEWGIERDVINPGTANRVHAGNVLNQPVFSGSNLDSIILAGDTYQRARTMEIKESESVRSIVESDSISDYYKSDDQAIGRVNVVNKDAKQINFKTGVRFSNPYSPNSNYVGLAEFEALNGIVLPNEYGRVEKLQWARNVLLAICNFETIAIYVNESVIQDATGSDNLLALGDKVLGYWRQLAGRIGTHHPASVAEFNGQVYWFDYIKGKVARYAADGITVISDYKMRNFFRQAGDDMDIPENGEFAVGGFNDRYGEYELTLSYGGPATQTVVFSEPVNRWVSFRSYTPNFYCRVDGDRLLSFLGGVPWLHDDYTEHNSFYGVRYPSTITVVGNQFPDDPKIFLAMAVESTIYDASLGTWYAPTITVPKPESQVDQVSELVEADMVYRNGQWRSDFLRDIRSLGNNPLINGDRLRGKVIDIKLQNDNYGLVIIHNLFVYSQVDPILNTER